MRQYKVKQRYLNKLLESVAVNADPDAITKGEEAIRAALELPDPPSPVHRRIPLARSASYYSLPEFIIEEEEDELGEDAKVGPHQKRPNI